MHQPDQLEVEDVTLLQSCQAWDGRKAVEKEVALKIFELNFFELGVDRVSLLLLVLVSKGTFLDVKLETIVGIVESPGVFIGTLHRIVAQQVKPEVSSRERAPLRVVDRYVNLQVELMEIQSLSKIQKA